MFIDLMNHPHFEKTDSSSLRFALFTGAPMPPEVALQIVKKFGGGIFRGDGTAECASNVLSLPDSPIEVIAESPRLPLAVGNEVKIVDPKTNRIVPVGVLGEICHRGSTNVAAAGLFGGGSQPSQAIREYSCGGGGLDQ